jgi:hypothetical protein
MKFLKTYKRESNLLFNCNFIMKFKVIYIVVQAYRMLWIVSVRLLIVYDLLKCTCGYVVGYLLWFLFHDIIVTVTSHFSIWVYVCVFHVYEFPVT